MSGAHKVKVVHVTLGVATETSRAIETARHAVRVLLTTNTVAIVPGTMHELAVIMRSALAQVLLYCIIFEGVGTDAYVPVCTHGVYYIRYTLAIAIYWK